MCSLHLTHPSAHTLGTVGSRRCGARGAVGVQCLAQGSHFSRGQVLPGLRFEPTTSGYKSDALSTRTTTALNHHLLSVFNNLSLYMCVWVSGECKPIFPDLIKRTDWCVLLCECHFQINVSFYNQQDVIFRENMSLQSSARLCFLMDC